MKEGTKQSTCTKKVRDLCVPRMKSLSNSNCFDFEYAPIIGGCSISKTLLEKVIVPLDDNLFRARKRQSTLPTDDDFSVVTKLDARDCQKWASCASCQAFQTPTTDNMGTDYLYSNNTLISEDSKYSDEGFVDDVVVSNRSSQSDEGFVNEILTQDDSSVEEHDHESGATCLFILLSMTSRDGNRWHDLNKRKQARHLERKDTFIRL